MKHHRNNCKQSFIISAMEKIYEDNFDQNGPSYFCYLIFTSTLSSCYVLANHFFHVFFQTLILGAVTIFLLSHIYKYAVFISCISQSFFSMYFSNLNLRSRSIFSFSIALALRKTNSISRNIGH